MKTNSIFFKIRIAFGLSVFLILSVFALFYTIQKHYHETELRERLMHASKMVKHMKEEPGVLGERLIGLQLGMIDEATTSEVLNSPNKKEVAQMGPARIFTVENGSKKYIGLIHPNGIDVFEDKKPGSPIPILLLVALIAILGVLTLFYRSILANLSPLTEIKTRVESFAKNGELPPRNMPFCDEIEAVSNAFDETATHLSNISQARSLFLRNIAHELKTPLSKGRFLTEIIQNEELKDRFHTLFTHFDALINELLQVERLTAKGLLINKKEYSLQDCIDEAVESGFLDEASIDMQEIDARVCVDFRLFVLALKNLLTNAIKYADDGKVKIEVVGNELIISNKAPPLKRPIEQLFEPFVKGDESREGLGLGLYIVRQILDAHGVKLRYGYNEGIHLFYLDKELLSCKS